jgi:excisionase family DNA binding protein
MELITVREAARRLEVSTAPVYALCAERKLTHLRVGTGRGTIRIRMEDLVAFIENRKVEPRISTNATILQHIKLPSGG